MPRWKRFVLCVAFASLCCPSPGNTGRAIAQEHTRTHYVQPGDTLLDLELFYNTSPQELVTLNNLDRNAPFGAGQEILVPVAFEVLRHTILEPTALPIEQHSEPFHYSVQRGDTLLRIALRFNVSLNALIAANQITNANTIYVGQQLLIPVGTSYDGVVDLPPSSADPPAPAVSEGKQITIMRSRHQLYAFENGLLVRQFVVSLGLPATPTVKGSFAVYYKIASQRMSGPGYDLPNVPWVMYFYRGYAIHGTYWHNNFGQPMSHGCVNMRTPEAEWLYHWAPTGTPVLVTD